MTPVSLLAFLSPTMQTAFTPIWVISLGVLVGLIVLALLWGIWFLAHRATAREAMTTIVEGPLLPIAVTACILAVLGIIGFGLVRDPGRILMSLNRLGKVEPFKQTFVVADLQPPEKDEFGVGVVPPDKVIPLDLRRSELVKMTLTAEGGKLIVFANQADAMAWFRLQPDEPYPWIKSEGISFVNYFPQEEIKKLYIRGAAGGAPKITIEAVNQVAYPEVAAIPITAGMLVLVFLLYFGQQALFPKIAAVSLATAKSEMAQPVFLFVTIIGAAILAIFTVLPYNTFGEDIKMLKMTGLDVIKILGIFISLWAAGNSVSDEIEGRTALTLLSKPVRRHEFILGKMSGIAWTALAFYVMLGVWLLVLVCYRSVIDARESAKEAPQWQAVFTELARTAPGLVLHYMETILFGALGVAISTRLPMVANFVICLTVYMLGHLTPLLVQSSALKLPWVQFMAQLVATVFPVLEYFDVNAAIAAGLDINVSYMLWALLYCGLYSGAAILLALILFEDRDLA